MTGVIATIPRVQFSNALGIPLAGGKLSTFLAGTNTPEPTYQDQGLTIANPTTITLDATGSCVLWLDPGKSYKFLLKSALGATQPGWPVDNVTGAGALSIQLKAALGEDDGASAVGFIQAPTRAVRRTVQEKLRESVSVLDFGAKRDGASDDFAAFQDACDALPTHGGKIVVPDGVYMLSKQPNWGTRSIMWDFGPGATFVGPGTGQNKFPSMQTNGGQIAAGPYIKSQSRIPYDYSTPFAGGVAAFQVEMIQPIDVVGQSVAIYAGAEGSNPHPNANVWALNLLVKADHGAGGVYQGAEIDIDCFSPDAYMKGISLNGIGDYDADVGLEIIRADETKWSVGIDIMNTTVGMQVRNTAGLEMGVAIGGPTAQPSAAFAARLLKDGGDGVVIQRFTDTEPVGSAFRIVNAAGDKNMVIFDVLGNLLMDEGSLNVGGRIDCKYSITGQNLKVIGGGAAMPEGQLCITASTAPSASAGGAALPAGPAMFLAVFHGEQVYKIPLYNV